MRRPPLPLYVQLVVGRREDAGKAFNEVEHVGVVFGPYDLGQLQDGAVDLHVEQRAAAHHPDGVAREFRLVEQRRGEAEPLAVLRMQGVEHRAVDGHHGHRLLLRIAPHRTLALEWCEPLGGKIACGQLPGKGLARDEHRARGERLEAEPSGLFGRRKALYRKRVSIQHELNGHCLIGRVSVIPSYLPHCYRFPSNRT